MFTDPYFTREKLLHAPCSMLRERGQVMLLTVMALGGVILGATTLAGLLVTYQIRQSTDLGNSARAVYASDTGLEWGLYQFFKPGASRGSPTMTNNTFYAVKCYDAGNSEVSCQSDTTTHIRSVGQAANVSRAFELTLSF